MNVLRYFIYSGLIKYFDKLVHIYIFTNYSYEAVQVVDMYHLLESTLYRRRLKLLLWQSAAY